MTDDKYGDGGEEAKDVKFTLDLAVDDDKIRQIQECMKKGRLTITLDSSSLRDSLRAGDPYLYD
jgi:hypothetical protein